MALSKCGVITDSDGKELKQHGSTAFPVAIYDDDLLVDTVAWHWHEELELAVVVNGSTIAATDSQKTEINEGNGFFVNTGVLHSAWHSENAKNSRLQSIVFHAELIGGENYSVFWEKYLNPLFRNVKFLCLNSSEDWQRKILDIINLTWHLCEEEKYGFEIHVRDQLSQIILLLTENLTTAPLISISEQRNEERIKLMLSFIHQHFSEPLDVNKIAQSASVSESECLRCFHNIIGTTPIQYLREFRLKKAARLLTTTNIKIADIAEQCGIPEVSYFSKLFREKHSLTPSEYRKIKLS